MNQKNPFFIDIDLSDDKLLLLMNYVEIPVVCLSLDYTITIINSLAIKILELPRKKLINCNF